MCATHAGAFNRTVVELKHTRHEKHPFPRYPFNRTVVELKLMVIVEPAAGFSLLTVP